MSILTTGLDDQTLLQRTTSSPHREIWERMQATWRNAAEREAKATRIEKGGACGSAYMTDGLMEAALTARVTKDDTALRHVLAQVRKIAYVYRDVPASLEADAFGRTTYFSNAELALAWSLCGDQWPAQDVECLFRLYREHFSKDHNGFNMATIHGHGHNIHYTRWVSAALCALVLGDVAGGEDTDAILQMGENTTRLYCHAAVDPDGVSLEASLYGLAVFRWMYLFAELYRPRHDLFASLPTLHKIPAALGGMVLPTHDHIPDIGDSAHGEGVPMREPWLLLTARHYGRTEDLALWCEGGGPQEGQWQSFLWWDGTQPAQRLEEMDRPRAFFAPMAGVAALRSSWSSDATHLSLLSQGRGHAAAGHCHADAGHISLFTRGEHLTIDPGYWNLNEDQHSVILVNGKGNIINKEGDYGLQPLRGYMPRHEHHGWLDYVLVEADHAKDCIWADRHILFLRGEGAACTIILLDDVNPNNNTMSMLWQLQVHPENRISLLDDRRACVTGKQAALDLTFLNPLPGDYPSCPHRLTLSQDQKEGAEPPHDHSVRPRLLAKQTGLNGRLLTVLTPRGINESPARVLDRTSQTTFRAEVSCGDYTDTIIASPNRGWIDFPDVKGISELAVIRRDASGNILQTWTIEGATLEFPATQ